MTFAGLATALSILLTLVGSLLNLRWIRLGSTVFLAGTLVLFMRVTYSLFHLSGLSSVTAVQAVFIASLCVVWATAASRALAMGRIRDVRSVFLAAAPSFYILVLLAILIGSGTLHAVLIDACVVALVGIIVASRGHRPHGLGRFVAAVLLPASLLIHTSSVVGAELSESSLKIVIPLLGYAVLAAVVPAHPWFLRVVTERDDAFITAAAVSVVYLGYFGLTLGLSEVADDVTLWAFSMLGFVTLFYASAHAFARRDLGGCIAYYVSATTGFFLSFTSILMLLRVDTAMFIAAIVGAGPIMFVPAILPPTARRPKSEVAHTLTSALPPTLALLLASGAFPSISLAGRALLAATLSGLQGLSSTPVLGLLVLSIAMLSAAVANSLKFRMRLWAMLASPLFMNASLTLILFCVLLRLLLGPLTLSVAQFMPWLLLIGFTSGFSAWLLVWHEVLGGFLERIFTHLPSAVVSLEMRFRYAAEGIMELLEVVETEERFLATLSLLVLLAATAAVILLGGVMP